MGVKTGAVLIQEAGLLAGRDDLGSRCAVWLQAWLDSIAAGWPWPELQQQAQNVALPAGTTSLVVGGTGGTATGITTNVNRIVDNIWVYSGDYRSRGRARIAPMPQAIPTAIITNTANGRAMPNQFGIRKIGNGSWRLTPDPIPDRAYLLTFDYQVTPVIDLSQPLWYPNDFTVLHGLVAAILEFADGPEQNSTRAAQASVGQMLASDRIKFGQVPGINDRMNLDDSVFS